MLHEVFKHSPGRSPRAWSRGCPASPSGLSSDLTHLAENSSRKRGWQPQLPNSQGQDSAFRAGLGPEASKAAEGFAAEDGYHFDVNTVAKSIFRINLETVEFAQKESALTLKSGFETFSRSTDETMAMCRVTRFVLSCGQFFTTQQHQRLSGLLWYQQRSSHLQLSRLNHHDVFGFAANIPVASLSEHRSTDDDMMIEMQSR